MATEERTVTEERTMAAAAEPMVRRAQDARGVRTLTLNRPQSFNALSEAMLVALQEELDSSAAIASSSDRKSTRLNSSHGYISYAVFCLKKKKIKTVLQNADRC